MSKSIKNKITLTIISVIFIFLFMLNFITFFPNEVNANTSYGLKYVANKVWHCTTGGSNGCDTPSSHVWIPVQ